MRFSKVLGCGAVQYPPVRIHWLISVKIRLNGALEKTVGKPILLLSGLNPSKIEGSFTTGMRAFLYPPCKMKRASNAKQ